MEIHGLSEVFARIQKIKDRIIEIHHRYQKPNFSQYLKNEIENNETSSEEKTTTIHNSKEQKELWDLVKRVSQEEGVSPELIWSIIKVESNFDPDAISKKGAIGLMQLMPETAKMLNVNPHDVEQNIRGGIRYLKELAKKYDSLEKILAAYNAGPSAVDRYEGIPPYSETQNYIKRIKKILNQLED
ncbi:MAG: lytic transglycosylase domain-containing protein [Leptospiraceae bacterium]|nr:lytic transglycosylase domain-containing protein [Leptospiraceae bacterium]MDW7976175.1 lytic transglycosylase domain-containing protein [Leptospiraceae bacterium]